MSRLRRSLRVAGLIIVLAGTTGLSTPPDSGANGDDVPYVHASGLHVVGEDFEPPVPESLRDAYAALDLLAESNPEDFGYVAVDEDGVSLKIGVASDAAPALLGRFKQGLPMAASAPAFGLDEKEKRESELSKGSAALNKVAVSSNRAPSRATTEFVKDSVIELSQDPEFSDADIWQSRVDRVTGKVVLSVGNLTDALAKRLVEEYGVDRLVIDIAPNPQLVLSAGRQNDNSPFYGGAHILVSASGRDLQTCRSVRAYCEELGQSGM